MGNKPDSVTVISVAYNSAAIIGNALASVMHVPEVARVVVVDNASSDDVQAVLPQGAECIRSPENIGYGRGCNLGLETVQTPFALLLNPDAVLHEGALAEMLRVMHETPDAAIVAPLLLLDDGEVYTSYKRDVFTRERFGNGLDITPEGNCCAEFLSGAVWLIRMDAWRTIDGFDPKIFLFYEDDDACMRLRKAGFSLVLAPAAISTHSLGKSTSPTASVNTLKQFHLAWSRLYIEQKHRGHVAAKKSASILLLQHVAKWLWACVVCNKVKQARQKARIHGILTFLF